MKKKEKTPEEQAEHDHKILVRRKVRAIKTRVFNNCPKQGLAAMTQQFKFLKTNPKTKPLYPELTHEQTVDGWSQGIASYKETNPTF